MMESKLFFNLRAFGTRHVTYVGNTRFVVT